MMRMVVVLAGAMLLVTLDPALALAQAVGWPTMPSGFARGPGFYFSIPKLLSAWLLMLCWVRTTDWVNQDCDRVGADYSFWNTLVFFTFVVSFILFWILPWFWLGFLLMVLEYLVPLGAYIYYRNKKVLAHEKVLTRAHIRHMASSVLSKVGVKIAAEAKDPSEGGPPVKLAAMGAATDRDNNVNLLTARQLPGFLTARELIHDMLGARGEAFMLDFTPQAVAVRFQIDGVWHDREPISREDGDSALIVMKTLSALNPQERRPRQEGLFGAEIKITKYNCRLLSQVAQNGERAVVQLDESKSRFKTLDDIGMRAKMQEQLREVMLLPKGMVLFSTLPGGGLSTLIDASLRSTDRLMRDVIAIEDRRKREKEVENIEVATYDSGAGENPMTLLPKVVRKYPNVLVVRDLVNAETASFLREQVEQDRLVIAGIRAKDGTEALLRVLQFKVPPKEFAAAASAVVYARLIRKLCETCKEAYPPPPEVLQQMGIPAGRLEALYRPPQEPQKKGCPACKGIGYVGRTAMYELLVLDNDTRQILATSPKPEVLKAAFRKAGQRFLQEEGIILVAKGITSLQELMRVLKQ